MEFEWNIFPGFTTLQLIEEVKRSLLRLDETPENFTRKIIFMSMFNDISCGSKVNEKDCLENAKLVFLHAKRFGKGQWSFIGPGSEKKWYCISEGQSTISMGQYGWKDVVGIRRKWLSNFQRYESIVQRSTQKQRTRKTFDTLCGRFGNDWDYFSHNCLCKPAQSLRSNRGDMWREWIPSRGGGVARGDGTWIHSSKRRSSITTKRMDPREHQRLGPYEKLQPVTGTVNMELRSEFGLWTEDNTHSWVRISHGSN